MTADGGARLAAALSLTLTGDRDALPGVLADLSGADYQLVDAVARVVEALEVIGVAGQAAELDPDPVARLAAALSRAAVEAAPAPSAADLVLETLDVAFADAAVDVAAGDYLEVARFVEALRAVTAAADHHTPARHDRRMLRSRPRLAR